MTAEFNGLGVEVAVVRVVDCDVRPGMDVDTGEGDQRPGLREKMLQADVPPIAAAIWLGHPSSVCRRVLERLDAELSETDDDGRMLTYDKVAAVAAVAVVGNMRVIPRR